jgi:hypothetical protein
MIPRVKVGTTIEVVKCAFCICELGEVGVIYEIWPYTYYVYFPDRDEFWSIHRSWFRVIG